MNFKKIRNFKGGLPTNPIVRELPTNKFKSKTLDQQTISEGDAETFLIHQAGCPHSLASRSWGVSPSVLSNTNKANLRQPAPAQLPQMEKPHLSPHKRTRIAITQTQQGGRRQAATITESWPLESQVFNSSHKTAVPTVGFISYVIPTFFFPPETLVLLRPATTNGREKRQNIQQQHILHERWGRTSSKSGKVMERRLITLMGVWDKKS